MDEPELSLHPALQRRMANLLIEYAASRQIVVSTHSPYFVPLEALSNGATVVRVFTDATGSQVSQLTPQAAQALDGLLADLNNPHTLGLDAREVFFLEDRVILVEGQEDVLLYPRMAKQLDMAFKGSFFGWGAGGADKMIAIASLLRDLGFQRVVGIVDGNRADVLQRLKAEFPQYQFTSIPTADIRSKPTVPEKPAVVGLLSSDGILKGEFRDAARTLVETVNAAF